jgi:hypothetical protein
MCYQPTPLPADAQRLCEELAAPPRLVAHLTLVFDAARYIVDGLRAVWPQLSFDASAVLFGAATHDLGKCQFPEELYGPGRKHEEHGATILESHGVPAPLARFASTHGTWQFQDLPLEDLLVCLADTVWKGQRIDDLETKLLHILAELTGAEAWEVFGHLDALLGRIADQGEERLAWQRAYT